MTPETWVLLHKLSRHEPGRVVTRGSRGDVARVLDSLADGWPDSQRWRLVVQLASDRQPEPGQAAYYRLQRQGKAGA